MSVKIFAAYHRASTLITAPWLEGIEVGSACREQHLGIQRDDSGENRSASNPQWCELTGWYWVYRNALPAHPEWDYVGFCHYRRYLLFDRKPAGQMRKVEINRFLREWEKIATTAPALKADIYLPEPFDCSPHTVEEQYLEQHHAEAWQIMKDCLLSQYPDYAPQLEEFCKGHQLHLGLTVAMKREYMQGAMQWCFGLLEVWEKVIEERKINLPPRTAGFIMERMMNVWYLAERQRGAQVEEVYSCLLVQPMAWWKRSLLATWHGMPLPRWMRGLLVRVLRAARIDITKGV